MSSRATLPAITVCVCLATLFPQTQHSHGAPVAKITVPPKDLEAFDETTPLDSAVRTKWELGGSYTFAWRSDLLGKRVQAEGIAWGEAAGQRILLDRSEIRIKGCDFSDADSGRLIRVIGTLKYDHGSWSKFGTLPPYFFIDSASYVVIDRVEYPALRDVDDVAAPIQVKPE